MIYSSRPFSSLLPSIFATNVPVLRMYATDQKPNRSTQLRSSNGKQDERMNKAAARAARKEITDRAAEEAAARNNLDMDGDGFVEFTLSDTGKQAVRSAPSSSSSSRTSNMQHYDNDGNEEEMLHFKRRSNTPASAGGSRNSGKRDQKSSKPIDKRRGSSESKPRSVHDPAPDHPRNT